MTLGNITLRFHPAGWPFIGIFAAVTLVCAFISGPVFFLCLILTGWCFYFFRDPVRVTPTRDGLIVSPADGEIVAIDEMRPDPNLGLGTEIMTRVSIFLNVFNVHVNRIPAEGVIAERIYRKGKFINASLNKASIDNERMALAIKLGGAHPYSGQLLGCVQIAGLIARRILCNVDKGQKVRAGQHYGLIRFGSRADIYLPRGLTPLVIIGQTAIGGETILADALANESQRNGIGT